MYFVLTTSSIWQLCHESFADRPWAASPRLEIPDGEQHKTLATVERIWQFLLDHRATRDDVLVCAGGGVICDLGGFAASTYKRGMPHINVPTTLLAMVDAASGGKTGFDYAGIKNAIGTYAQPLDTLVIPSLIASLPPRELLSGYGEMLKHALLDTPDHWHQLLQIDLETEEGMQALMPLIARSRAVKERIVAADPREQGLRRALNLGHTVGHALEAQMLANGQPAPHGYCVVWGMVAALYLSAVRCGFPRDILHQLEQVMLRYYGRPVCNCQDQNRLLDLMQQDKKNTAEGVRFTLLQHIGEPVSETVSPSDLREVLEYLFSL